MGRDNFDDLIRAKFDSQDFEPQPEGWLKLQAELDQPTTKRRAVIYRWLPMGVAACLGLVLASVVWFAYDASSPSPAYEPNSRIATTTQNEDTHLFENQPVDPHPHTTATLAIVETPLPDLSDIKEEQNATPASTPVSTLAHTTQEAFIPNPAPAADPTIVYSETVLPSSIEGGQVPIAPLAPNGNIASPQAHNTSISEPKLDFIKPTEHAQRKTYIHLTGGWNYSSLNSGFMAGINARQNISKKLYLEGDLAYAHGKLNQASVLTTAHYNSLTKGNSIHMPFTNAIIQQPTNFNYLQFNPSIGYMVLPKLTLSVGADMQQKLDQGTQTRTLVYTQGEIRLLPDFDMGITGRTEYNITPKMKAGILYREGINNLIRGNNTYFDRRYVQIQLKFRIFER